MNLQSNTPHLMSEFLFSYHVNYSARQKKGLRHHTVRRIDRNALSCLFGTQADVFLRLKIAVTDYSC